MIPRKHEWNRVRGLLERAMELDGEHRSRFIDEVCAGDGTLRGELEALLALDVSSGGLEPLRVEHIARALESEATPKRIGAYELERLLGSGGMGSVWLARRVGSGFEQRVAVKLIKRGMDTDELLRRFAHERAVLAALEHPNIARLYDGGSSDDGRPYLVMEYIDGEPLDRFCEQRGLSVRERIELFVSICSAVEHAHRNLIVHRDLKPSNVLVAHDGTPKLLDFGIAKVLSKGGEEREEERTRTAQRVLTPMYASPEHMRGEKLTTQSDVYSLGVMLYGLLSDAQPFDAERKPDSEPMPPSRAAQEKRSAAARGRVLEGDLDTIVLKAMKPEPARRYASVEQLADDLRRYLGGLPVLARPDTFRYRATKFVRRNRFLVAASAAVAASVVAGLVVSTILYIDARRARDKELEQRLLAADRLHGVLAIATSFTRDLDARLSMLAGISGAREQLLRAAAVQLEKLAQQAPGEQGVQLSLGWVYRDLADTLGNPLTNNRGHYEEAEPIYDKAIAIADALLELDPSDAHYADFGSSAYTARAELLRHFSRLEDARIDYGRAAEIARAVLPSKDGALDEALIRKLGNALGGLATIERDKENFAGAAVYESEMVTELERGWAKHPDDPLLKYTFANSLYVRGMGEYHRDDCKASVASMERALELLDQLCAEDSANTTFRRALATVQSNFADPLMVLGEMERATASAHSALDTWELVVRNEPDDEVAFYALIEFANRVGNLEQTNGHPEAARVGFERAVFVEEVLIQRYPDQKWRHSGHAMISAELASAMSELGHWRESFERAQAALDELDQIEHDPGRGGDWLYGRAMATTMFAECRIYAARDSGWSPAERRAQLDGAQELLAHARGLLLEAREKGELLTNQLSEFELIDQRVSRIDEIRAKLPEDP